MTLRKKTGLFLVAALVLVVLLTSCTVKIGGWTITIQNDSGSGIQVYIAPGYPGSFLVAPQYVLRMEISAGTHSISGIADGSSLCLVQIPPKTWDYVTWPTSGIHYRVIGDASFRIIPTGEAVPMVFASSN